MQPQTKEKMKLFHHTDNSFSSTSEGRISQRVWKTAVDQAFWNKNTRNITRLFDVFLHLCSLKTATILKCSALVAYLLHGVLVNFSQDYKTWLIKSGHSFMAFLPVRTEKRKPTETQVFRILGTQYTGAPSREYCMFKSQYSSRGSGREPEVET